MELLGIRDIDEVTENNIKKSYRKKVINAHPDKDGGTSEKFVELTHAKETLIEFLSAKAYTDPGCSSGECDTESVGGWEWFGSVIKQNNPVEINSAFRKMVGGVAIKLFDTMGTDNMLRTYEIFVKYRDLLCIDDHTLDELKMKISQTTHVIILNPTIDDLFDDNVYRYVHADELVNIPLWHNELYYDVPDGELVVKCVPILGEDVWITGNNDIHKCVDVTICVDSDFTGGVDWGGMCSAEIGKRSFDIMYGDLKMIPVQNVVFRNAGAARINTVDMYDVDNRSDVIIHISILFLADP
jgi:hypothetical protein